MQTKSHLKNLLRLLVLGLLTGILVVGCERRGGGAEETTPATAVEDAAAETEAGVEEAAEEVGQATEEAADATQEAAEETAAEVEAGAEEAAAEVEAGAEEAAAETEAAAEETAETAEAATEEAAAEVEQDAEAAAEGEEAAEAEAGASAETQVAAAQQSAENLEQAAGGQTGGTGGAAEAGQTGGAAEGEASEAVAGTPADVVISLSFEGDNAYVVDDTAGAEGVAEAGVENPTITLEVGRRYRLSNPEAQAHPFALRDAEGNYLLAQGDAEGSLEGNADIEFVDEGEVFTFTVTQELADQVDSYVDVNNEEITGAVEIAGAQ